MTLIGILILLNKQKQNYIVGVNYLPKEDSIYLDNGELSVFVNKLVYPSIIKINKDDYENILAKNIEIEDNLVIVHLKDNIAENIKESYLKLNKEIYENNWKCKNIIGCSDYQECKTDDIIGITILDNNTISFEVNNTNDLEFLTIPIVCGNVGDYVISNYIAYEGFTLSGKNNIEIKVIDKDNIDNVDLFITGNDNLEVKNKEVKNIYRYYDFLVLNNFTEDETNEINEIINNINNKEITISDIEFWCDSSYYGALITENLKQKFEENNIKFNVNYAESSYILDLLKQV